MGNQKSVVSRGLLPIYYSTTSGMSKEIANKFQTKAQDIGFTAPVTNVGDIQVEDFLQYEGPVVMFLSTYGTGDAPSDGETFLKWLQADKGERGLANISFIIMALGNSSFEHFCGHGRKVTEALLRHGAKQLIQMKKCDANIQAQSAHKVFQGWSQKVIDILTLRYTLRNLPLDSLTGGYTVQLKKGKIDWQKQLQSSKVKLGKQFQTFLKSPKVQVIHVKQMRGDAVQADRSTLWLRIKKPQQLKLWPGCNIHIYPENILMFQQHQENQIVQFKSKKQNSKLPFPPMNASDLKRIANLRQRPSNKILKNAILLSNKPNQLKDKYRQIIKQNKIQEINCHHILEELEPSFQFYADLGLNLPRAYTLASWNESHEYFDLCVSTLKDGLTSTYLKSLPKQLRINTFQSTFNVPSKPLIMIANGSGIAPFRSLIEYVASQQPDKRVPMKLYYGIQNEQTDFYFRSDFQRYQRQGLLQVKLAQSRKDPSKKIYIQELVEADKQLFREHLFKNQGLIYICGGREMEKAVNAAIFKAITLECKMPYKGFTILNNFKANKVIVEEVFG